MTVNKVILVGNLGQDPEIRSTLFEFLLSLTPRGKKQKYLKKRPAHPRSYQKTANCEMLTPPNEKSNKLKNEAKIQNI